MTRKNCVPTNKARSSTRHTSQEFEVSCRVEHIKKILNDSADWKKTELPAHLFAP